MRFSRSVACFEKVLGLPGIALEVDIPVNIQCDYQESLAEKHAQPYEKKSVAESVSLFYIEDFVINLGCRHYFLFSGDFISYSKARKRVFLHR